MDKSYEHIGRVPRTAAFASAITLYIVALIAAVLRVFVRWHYRQLRLLDDGFFLFAVACMTVSFGLWITYLPEVYITEALIYAPLSYLGSFGNILQIAIDIQVFSTAYIVISVTGIFAIKFSFLFFFRNLIDRLHNLLMYWNVIAIYTAVAWIISICISPVACPFYDSRAVQCAQGPYFHRALNISIVLLVFDITTDFLIISIPIIIIRRIKVPLKSKIYLALSLCLSFVMMVVAILQGATITYGGVDAIDIVWELYFQFVEVTLAILVVSLTAFRTFFVSRRSKNSRPSTESSARKKWFQDDAAKRIWKKMSTGSRTTDTDLTWSSDIPLSNRPLPTTIQPDTTYSEARRLPDRRTSDRKRSENETGLNSHPTLTTGDFGGTTIASQSEPEPYLTGTLDGPLLDVPMATPIQTPETEEPNPMRTQPRRPRSQISAERRISYWQRMIRVGIERAQAVLPGSRSTSVSTEGRHSPGGVPRHSHDRRVSPIETPPSEADRVREEV